jgi:hypothetical protein
MCSPVPHGSHLAIGEGIPRNIMKKAVVKTYYNLIDTLLAGGRG